MTGRHRFVPHTADLRLLSEGASPAEAITAALRGLLEAVFGRVPAAGAVRREPWLAGAGDDAVALVELLSEALYRATVRREAVVGFEGEPRKGCLMVATLALHVEPQREVKAVTFNDLVWRRREDGSWEGAVTLDL